MEDLARTNVYFPCVAAISVFDELLVMNRNFKLYLHTVSYVTGDGVCNLF